MDIYQIRLENFRAAVAIFGDRKTLAEKINMSTTLLNQYIGKNPTKRIGDEAARRLDLALEKSAGFVDAAGAVSSTLTTKATDGVAVELQPHPEINVNWRPISITGAVMPSTSDFASGLVEVLKKQEDFQVAVPNSDDTTRLYRIQKHGLGPGFMPGWLVAVSQTDAPGPSDIILTDPDGQRSYFGEYIRGSEDGHDLLSMRGQRLCIDGTAKLYRVIAILPPPKDPKK